MNYIFGILICFLVLGIIIYFFYYLYDNLNTISLSNDIIKNIITENKNLTKTQISDLQNKINIINGDYIKNNEIINKNYIDILTKLTVLNTTKIDSLNLINNKITELENKTIKLENININDLIISKTSDIKNEYSTKINENNNKLTNDITELVNTSITNNNNNLMNNINVQIQQYTDNLNKANILLSTNLTNYIQNNDNNYKNLKDIIDNYILSNNLKINQILANLSSTNIDTYITNNDLNIGNLTTQLQNYGNTQSQNLVKIEKSISDLQKLLYNNNTDINKLPNNTNNIIDAINNINDNLKTNITNLSNINQNLGDLSKLPNNSNVSNSINNLNDSLNSLLKSLIDVQQNIQSNNNKVSVITTLQNNYNNLNSTINTIQNSIGSMELSNNSRSLTESINTLNNIINNLQSNYNNNLNNITNIQNNIGDITLLPNNSKQIVEAINTINNKINSYNLDNISVMQQTLNNISNIIGNVSNLNQSYSYIKDITDLIQTIKNDIKSFNIKNNDVNDLLDMINKFLIQYENSYYTNYTNIGDFTNQINNIISKINRLNSLLISSNNFIDLQRYLASVINTKQGIINRLLESISMPQNITKVLINIQNSVNDLMNNNAPLKSDLVSLQTKFNSLNTMVGTYSFSNSSQTISSVLSDINKTLTDTITSNESNNTIISNNIQDLNNKLILIQNNISQLFNQTSNINNIQQQLSKLQENIGEYTPKDNNLDISTAISNIQNTLSQNTSTSTILTTNMNNIKNVIGNYQNALNGQDIITYITNLNSISSQLQSYIGNINNLRNNNNNSNFNSIVSSINTLHDQISTINNNLDNMSVTTLLTRLQSLELANRTLNATLGDLSNTGSSSTLSTNIQNLNNNMSLLMTSVGGMTYPYEMKDLSSTLFKIAKYIGNADLLENDLSTSIITINTSIKNINSIIGNTNLLNGIDIITYLTGIRNSLNNNRIAIDNMQTSFNTLQTSINTFSSNNNTLNTSITNLQNAIGSFTPSSNIRDISSALRYVASSIGNFVSNTKNPDIATNLNNINSKLSILYNDNNIDILASSSNALITGFTNISTLPNMSKYNTSNIINQLTQLNTLLPNFIPNSMNIDIVNKLNEITKEFENFKNIMRNNLINGLNTYNDNISSRGSYTTNQDLTIYTTINPLIINFNNIVNIILGTKDNPTLIGGINTINNNIIENNTNIEQLQQAIKFIGNYTPINNNPDISTAINNLQSATQYIGNYQSTTLNPNISVAIQNVQNAIGTYTSSTNIINSLNSLNTTLGNYRSTTTDPDISSAISNLQSSISTYIPSTGYSSNLGTAVLNLQSLTSTLNTSVNKFNTILGTYPITSPDINTAFNNINTSIRYIGNYMPTTNNPDISTAINNINTSVTNLQNNHLFSVFLTILDLTDIIFKQITPLYNNNSWTSDTAGFREGLPGALTTLYNNLQKFNNDYKTYGYNPNYVNLEINTNLVNLLNHCTTINTKRSLTQNMMFDEVYGIKYNNSLLITAISTYLGNNSQSIESSILSLQKTVNLLSNRVSNAATIVNDNNIENIKKVIPDVVRSLSQVISGYTNGLNTSASTLQEHLNTLLNSLNTYTQYSSNPEIYNNVITILNFIRINTSFNGNTQATPFTSYNTQIKILIPYLNIMTGSSTNPSIYAEIANIKSNIGIYNTPNSNITNDFNNLKSIIGAYNNTNYPNTTTPATITQDLINLNTQINNLKSSTSTASSTITSPLSIIGNIPVSTAIPNTTFKNGDSFNIVVSIQNGLVTYGYITGYTGGTAFIHNLTSQILLNNYPNRCYISNTSYNMPFIPSGTYNINSSEGLMINTLDSNQYSAKISNINSTITLSSNYSRNMEITVTYPSTISCITLNRYINAIQDYTNRTKNNNIYCIKGTINIYAPIQNIHSIPAQTNATTKTVNILGPTALNGINKGITINDNVNLSGGSLFVPQTTPQLMTFDSGINPNGEVISGMSYSYCPNNSYVCGMGSKAVTGGVSLYYPLCCNFNQ